MIYPAQKEDVFNYPFNILQSILIRTLNYVDEFIVIGHKFGDPNIVSAIKVALEERADFKLIIVNPSASEIKNTIFSNNVKVEAIDKPIEEWLPNAVKKFRRIAERKNEESEEKEQKREKEMKEKIIGEYVASQTPSFATSNFKIDPLTISSLIPEIEKLNVSTSKKCPYCGKTIEHDPKYIGHYCTDCQRTI